VRCALSTTFVAPVRADQRFDTPQGSICIVVTRKAEPDGRLITVELVRSLGIVDYLDGRPVAAGGGADEGGGGGGVVLRRDPEGYYYVKKVAAGAEGSGLEVGDSVREVDGVSVLKRTQQQVLKKSTLDMRMQIAAAAESPHPDLPQDGVIICTRLGIHTKPPSRPRSQSGTWD